MAIKLVSDTVDKADIQALTEWMNQDPTPQLTKGPLTRELESKWSQYLGVKNTVYVNSGSSALLLMLSTLLHGNEFPFQNKKIIVPGLSWITDVSSCTQLGLTPILCDCNLRDLSVDLNHLEKLFKRHKPAAFILVHVLGLVPDMEKIVALCKNYKVILLEDVCEAMGSEYKGKKLGTFGEMSVFSLYFGHHLSTVEGGFVCTDDERLASIALMMRSHGWDRDLSAEEQQRLRRDNNVDEFSAQYTFYYPGFNLRATDLQAFIGLRQIDKLEDIKLKRQVNYHRYNDRIEVNQIYLAPYSQDDTISNFAYPVIHPARTEIVKELKAKGVEVRPLIAGSMSLQPFWNQYYEPIFLPNCEVVHKYGFYLPNHQDLTEADINLISDIVNKVGKDSTAPKYFV